MKRAIRGGLLSSLLLLAACGHSSFDPPQRDGPAVLVDTGTGHQLWLASSQEEERSRHLGGGSRSIGKWVSERYMHLRLQAHDPLTANRTWLKTLLVVKDEGRGTGEGIRILGQQGGVVWVWLHDQLLALSAKDASVLADRARMEQANPTLSGMFPQELQFHAWTGTDLVVTLADGRRVKIDPSSLVASDYVIADEEAFRMAGFMATRWNGGYETKEFGVRHGLLDGKWIGLLSDREAKDGEDDSWGDHHADAAEILDEGATARRRFRQAVTRVPLDPYGKSFERLASLPPMANTDTFLQGRMLKATPAPGTPAFTLRGQHWKPTVIPPMRLQDPAGVLVLHRTRMDAQGRLALTRVGPGFSTAWTQELPLQELSNRWEIPSRVLLFGNWNEAKPGFRDTHEALVSVDLASGTWSGWDIGAEAALTQAP